MRYKIYLWFVKQRDKNHSINGFTFLGYIYQFILNQRWFWIKKSRNKSNNSH